MTTLQAVTTVAATINDPECWFAQHKPGHRCTDKFGATWDRDGIGPRAGARCFEGLRRAAAIDACRYSVYAHHTCDFGFNGTDPVCHAEVAARREDAGARVGGCASCEAGSPTRHAGSQFCESGSIASGGRRAHCTCARCF